MARGIFSGIDAHFRSKPPMDTALAAARGGKVKPLMDKVVDKPSSESLVPEKNKKPDELTLDDQIALEDADRAATREQSKQQADDLEKMLVEKSAAEKSAQQKSNASQKVIKPSDSTAVQKKTAQKPKTPSKQQEKATHYVVKKGDTLSGIASRNKISIVKLREFNQLDDNQVRIGQTIRIPVSSN
jgi:LysM repeat protein